MKCTIEDCAKIAEKRGWCGAHYYRWRIHGSPTGGRLRNGTALKFLNNFIDPETDVAAKVRQIKTRPHEKRAALATEFDVHASNIWHIRREKTWGWIK